MFPSVSGELKTHRYHHRAPNISGPVILGVDEAGRGPVLGPMVYACAYCSLSYVSRISSLGFNDSKVLTASTRDHLLRRIIEDDELSANIGWATTSLSAAEICDLMLRPVNQQVNLNQQAHEATIELIQRVVNSGVAVSEAYIDTVGTPETYQRKLSQIFPTIKITVSKKADALYPIVSCASVCAKVTRDETLKHHITAENGECSGYPSDVRTTEWLRRNLDKMFGWGPLVRYSWSTAKEIIEAQGYRVKWPDEASNKRGFERLLEHKLKNSTDTIGFHVYGTPWVDQSM